MITHVLKNAKYLTGLARTKREHYKHSYFRKHDLLSRVDHQ